VHLIAFSVWVKATWVANPRAASGPAISYFSHYVAAFFMFSIQVNEDFNNEGVMSEISGLLMPQYCQF
jgi:hypothetical protein